MDKITSLRDRLTEFKAAREWEKFHTAKNLILAINGEAGELAACMQWKNNSDLWVNEDLKKQVRHEIADIFIYLINLSNELNIDLILAAHEKIDINESRYPVDKCKGIAKKHTEL